MSVWQDLKVAVRALWRAPAFTLTALVTLALGIGSTTAIFSVVQTVLLDPLPYPESDRLVVVGESPWIPAEIVLGLEQSSNNLEAIASFYPQRFAVTGGAQPFQVEGARVTPNFFRLLQAGMALGRDFVEADARPGSPRTAILRYGVWQTRYGGSPEVLGRILHINGEPHEIIGVTARRFRQLAPRSDNPGLWTPFEVEPTNTEGLNEGINFVIPLARLKDGVALQHAQSELDAALASFKERHPELEASNHGFWSGIQLAFLKSELIRDSRTALLFLQLATGLLFLIACVNVTNLLLARFISRQRELALRAALGASRGRLVRRLLSESALLFVLGGTAGVLLMLAGLKLVLSLAPRQIPRLGEVSIDLPVLVFALGVSALAGLLFGGIPALLTTRRSPGDALQGAGRAPNRSRGQQLASQALVVAEVALTLALLVGAGLLMRSFFTLVGQETGFRTEGIVAVPVNIPDSRYENVPELEDFYHRALDRVRQVPGVEAVALSNNLPSSRAGSTREYLREGGSETVARGAQYAVVSSDYFRALDIPLLRGRYLEEADRRGSLRVAVVDEALARATWPGQDPLGKRFRFEEGEDTWRTVVGVVGNIRGGGLANDPGPGFYISYQQRPETPTELNVGRKAVFLVRSRLDREALAGPLRQAAWEADPVLPLPAIASLQSLVVEGVAPERFRTVLLAAFAVVALALVLAGIYGVVEYLVAERTHEFGVRMALGATGGDVMKNVIVDGLRLTVVGVVLGVVGVFALTRYLTGMLFGITPRDPVTLAASVALVTLVTLAACLIPARRATRVDPVIALKAE